MNRLTTLALALAAVQAVALPAFAEDAPAADTTLVAKAETKSDVKLDAKASDTKAVDAGKKADVAAAAKGKLDQDVIRKRREAGAVAAKEQNTNPGAVSPGPDGSTRFVGLKPQPAPQKPG